MTSTVLKVTTVSAEELEDRFRKIVEKGSEIIMAIESIRFIAEKYNKNDKSPGASDLKLAVLCGCRRLQSYIETLSSKQDNEDTTHDKIAAAMMHHIQSHKSYLEASVAKGGTVHLPGYDELKNQKPICAPSSHTYGPAETKPTKIHKLNSVLTSGLSVVFDITSSDTGCQSLLPLGQLFELVDASETRPIEKRFELATICWAYYTFLVCFFSIAGERNKALNRPDRNAVFIAFLNNPFATSTYGKFLKERLELYRDFTVDYRMEFIHKNSGVKKAFNGLKTTGGVQGLMDKLKELADGGDASGLMSLLPNFMPS